MLQLIIKKNKSIQHDILSGLTVALALIPEAIAFSFVAHVDPKVGLYAAFIMGLITAIFGGRPGMISGATGAVAIIYAPLVISLTKTVGAASALQHLFLAVIIMGIIQVAFGCLKFGKFIRLIPHSVMLGFVNGLAIIIFKAQFSQFYIADHLNEGTFKLIANNPLFLMFILIAITMIICHFLPKLTKAIPATLVAIIAVTLISLGLEPLNIKIYTVLDFVSNMDPTKTTIAASFPSFILPIFSLSAIKTVLPYSILAAFVGLIESLMTLILIDELTETRGKSNKESIGQGIANIANGFFGGMGGCAMIGQSMINIRGGGRGRLSGITAAIFLLIFFVFGAPLIEIIPLAALIGVMFMVAIATFEWSSLRLFNKIPKADIFVIIIVSVTTVIVDLAFAVLLGIIITTMVFAWNQGKKIKTTLFINEQGHKVYQLEGPLFFGSAQSFKELFEFKTDPKHVVIDFKNTRVYDHSGLEALQNISDRYNKYNKKLHLINISKECGELIKKAEHIVELNIIEDLNWHLAIDKLA